MHKKSKRFFTFAIVKRAGEVFAFVLAACGTARVTHGNYGTVSPTEALAPEQQKTSDDSILEFLLAATATDFHIHGSSDSLRFRNVRFGHVIAPGGGMQYMLCGQFMPVREETKSE